MAERPPRIVVTGAAGFIGGHIVAALLEHAPGAVVVASDRPGTLLDAARDAGAEAVVADLHQPAEVAQLAAGADVIVHAAALFDPGLAWEVVQETNVTAVHRLCEAAAQAGVRRVVMISSAGVYGRPRLLPARESDPKKPLNAYELSKWEGEQAALSYNGRIEVTALRPAPVYGPRARHGVAVVASALQTITHARGLTKLPVFRGGPRLHFAHAADVARAAVLLTRHPRAPGNVYNVADRAPLSAAEMLQAVAGALDIEVVPVVPFPGRTGWTMLGTLAGFAGVSLTTLNGVLRDEFDRLAGVHGLVPALRPVIDDDVLSLFDADRVYDTAVLRNLGFTWTYPEFRAGFTATVQWYRDNRWLV